MRGYCQDCRHGCTVLKRLLLPKNVPLWLCPDCWADWNDCYIVVRPCMGNVFKVSGRSIHDGK